MVQGLLQANAPHEVIQAAIDHLQNGPNDFHVYSENWQVVTLFLAVGTQWNISFDGQLTGINYTALEAAMSMSNIRKKLRSKYFSEIRLMENAAINAIHAIRKK